MSINAWNLYDAIADSLNAFERLARIKADATVSKHICLGHGDAEACKAEPAWNKAVSDASSAAGANLTDLLHAFFYDFMGYDEDGDKLPSDAWVNYDIATSQELREYGDRIRMLTGEIHHRVNANDMGHLCAYHSLAFEGEKGRLEGICGKAVMHQKGYRTDELRGSGLADALHEHREHRTRRHHESPDLRMPELKSKNVRRSVPDAYAVQEQLEQDGYTSTPEPPPPEPKEPWEVWVPEGGWGFDPYEPEVEEKLEEIGRTTEDILTSLHPLLRKGE